MNRLHELADPTGHCPLMSSCDSSASIHRLKVQGRISEISNVGAVTVSGRSSLARFYKKKSNNQFTMVKAKGRAKEFQDPDEPITKGMS